jgi:hypothetical protein
VFAKLEDQMAAMTRDGYVGGGSPDIVDALVWAISELMLAAPPAPQPVFGIYGRFPSNQFGYIPGVGISGHAGSVYASRPAEWWARQGVYHPNDKKHWQAKGVLPPDEGPK